MTGGSAVRQVRPGRDQVLVRAVVPAAAGAGLAAPVLAGGTLPVVLVAVVLGTAVLTAVRPDSATSVVPVLGLAWAWVLVPQTGSPWVLLVAAAVGVLHGAATLAAETPPLARVDAALARLWAGRTALLVVVAAAVWGVGSLAPRVPDARWVAAPALLVLAGVLLALTLRLREDDR